MQLSSHELDASFSRRVLARWRWHRLFHSVCTKLVNEHLGFNFCVCCVLLSRYDIILSQTNFVGSSCCVKVFYISSVTSIFSDPNMEMGSCKFSGKVFDAVEQASRDMLQSGSTMTQQVVTHKYVYMFTSSLPGYSILK